RPVSSGRRAQGALSGLLHSELGLVQRKARVSDQLIRCEFLAVGSRCCTGQAADPTDSPSAVFPMGHERGELPRWPLRANTLTPVEQASNSCSRVAPYECELRDVTLQTRDPDSLRLGTSCSAFPHVLRKDDGDRLCSQLTESGRRPATQPE